MKRPGRSPAQRLDNADPAGTADGEPHLPAIMYGEQDAAVVSRDPQLEVAVFIESLSAELRIMAREADLDSLAYFLEMARIEASIQIERRAALTRD